MVSPSRSSRIGPRSYGDGAAIEDLMPAAFHNTEQYAKQYANNRVECNHGRLKARLRRCADSNATIRRE